MGIVSASAHNDLTTKRQIRLETLQVKGVADSFPLSYRNRGSMRSEARDIGWCYLCFSFFEAYGVASTDCGEAHGEGMVGVEGGEWKASEPY